MRHPREGTNARGSTSTGAGAPGVASRTQAQLRDPPPARIVLTIATGGIATGEAAADAVNIRLRLDAEHESWMLMSGIIALCALVVVAALILPLFGPRVAIATAVGLVAAIVLACYLICVPRAFVQGAIDDQRGGAEP